jgi:hypothetical protein
VVWPASEVRGVVTRVESDAESENNDGAPKEEDREVQEEFECITGVFVERTVTAEFTTTEVRGEEFGV